MTDLSPQALVVWKAYLNESEWEVTQCELDGVAAALVAAVDQVVPDDGVASSIERIVENRIRRKLLAIAAELRGLGDSND